MHNSIPIPRCNALCLALAATLSLLSGCISAPPPRAVIRAQALPGVELPDAWRSQPKATATTAMPIGWVDTFREPRLATLVSEAIANNRDLAIAATRVDQAAAAADIAQAQLNPAVGLLARLSSRPLSELIPVLSGAVFKIVWEIDLWGKLRYARNAADATHAAANEDYRFAQQSIAAATAKAWFLVNATAIQQRLSKEMVRNAETLVELSDRRLHVGAGSEKEVAQARASLASYQDAAQQVQLAHRQAIRTLELLLGRYPGAELQMPAILPSFPEVTPIGTPVQILERRPDLIAAQRRVDAAFNRVGEAKRTLMPSLSLSANLGWVDNDRETGIERGGNTRNLGFQSFAPLYNGGALKGNIQLRTHEQREAIASYGRIALHAMGEVENALDAENLLAQREASLKTALAQYGHALALEQDSFKIGLGDLRAVQQSQLARHTAELALLHVRRERLERRVDLHLALGGDFFAKP